MTDRSSQRAAFLASEGDAWFQRNCASWQDLAARAAGDPLLAAYRELDLAPRRALEVGASDGWRLEVMRRARPDARYCGLEPSARAVVAGRARHPEVALARGTADRLPYRAGSFELVTLGFCLYLCDRADLFRIAAEVDRVLAPEGFVAVFDFHADEPHCNPYAHRAGLHSYKMDHARLFTWNPAYRCALQDVFAHPGTAGMTPDNQVAVTILRRDLAAGWPARRPS